MKTIHQKIIIPASISLLTMVPVMAIEPPKDDAPPPPSIKPSSPPDSSSTSPTSNIENHEEQSRSTLPTQESSAFIGIISDDIPDALSAHIGVKKGEGVIIRDLAPNGPAENAGFVKFDVITHVGGKTVGSPLELSREISNNKAGDEVAIDFIHQGAKSSKNVKLESRPENIGRQTNPRQLGHLNLDDMPDAQAERIREMIERQLRGMMQESQEFQDSAQRRGRATFRESRGFRNEGREPQGDNRERGLRGFQFKSDATFRLMDNDGTIEMKSSDGQKDITVRDHDGKVIWSGPWDTDKDKEAAPDDIRNRIEKFNFDDGAKGGGFRFRMRQGIHDDGLDGQ